MTYSQKNTAAALGSNIIILIYGLIRFFRIYTTKGLDAQSIYRLWFTIIALTIILIIFNTILFHIFNAIFQAIISGGTEEPNVDSVEDERDEIIKLKGTNVAHIIYGIGIFFGMLTMVLGQSPLVMFSILILAGVISEIASTAAQLIYYSKGI